MKVKEILNLTSEELEKKMTYEEFERMQNLNLNINTFLNYLQDSAKQSCDEENAEHVTISEYLDFLEELKGFEL